MQIEQIRQELTWRLRHKVLYPDSKLYEMEMEEDNDGLHFAVFENNAIIAVISLFQKEDDYQFRKFAVDHDQQGKGVGSQLLNYVTDFVKLNGGSRLWCNARTSAIGFYLKAGFGRTGKLFSKNGFDYEILEKTV